MKTTPRTQVQRSHALEVRRGDMGEFYVPVIRRVSPGTDGSTVLQLRTDLLHAPIPERRYAADSAWVDRVDDAARIVFGQRKLVGAGLRSIVIVTMSAGALGHLLDTCADFRPKLDELLARNKMTARVSTPGTEEPSHAVQVVSNIVAMAYSGRESVLDFYHYSPRAISLVQNNQSSDLAVDPVVRVDVSTELLAGILVGLSKVKAELPGEVE